MSSLQRTTNMLLSNSSGQFLLIITSVILAMMSLTACNLGQAAQTSSQTADTDGQQGIREQRPYTANSIWNSMIEDSPTYDQFSEQMVATIGLQNEGRITSDASQFTYPVYYADESTPRWDVPCLVYKCTIVTSATVISKTSKLQGVPIPADAQPSQGHDAQMIIIDSTTLNEYNLWQVKHTEQGWTASNGSIYNIGWDGMPQTYGSRGAGVPYFAGLIRPWEIAKGRIEHAIAFGYPEPAADKCVFPATKTDGKSTLPYALPEGARLQLDPSLTDTDFDEMGLDRTGRIIARALQEYGMILIDYSTRPKIYAENLSDNPSQSISWSDDGLNLTETTISDIPYVHFRVLALPAAYWDSSVEQPNETCHQGNDVAASGS